MHSSPDDNEKYVREQLEKLRPIFAKAAIGDFSVSLPTVSEDDEFSELYAGIGIMLDVIHKQISSLEQTNAKLAQRIKEQEETQSAILNIMEDLETTQAQTEQEKLRSEALIASIRDGLFAVDASGAVTFINDRALALFDLDRESSLGKPYGELFPMENKGGHALGPDERPMERAINSRAVTQSNISDPLYYVRKDGSRFPASITASPILYEGLVIGALNMFRDITEEQQLDQAKNEFISIASHQLRTPLTGIFWVVERFLKKEAVSEKGKGYLNDILLSARRLAQLVDTLLSVSRIEGGVVAVRPVSVDAVEFITQYLHEARPISEEKGIVLKFEDHPARLPVMTDENAFHNILQALVSNAIEYTPEKGSVTIRLSAEKNMFTIDVTDTGIGIPRDDQARIFEKFTRAKNAELVKPGGTGLGLYIASRATAILGGTIRFESPPKNGKQKKGTRFVVSLPVRSQEVREGKPLL